MKHDAASTSFTTPRRLGFALWLAGMIGIVIVVTTHLPSLLPLLLKGRALPVPLGVVLVGGVIQAGLLLALATWAGIAMAAPLDLRAPAFEAFAARQPLLPALRPQWLPGVGVGVLAGLFLFACSTLGPAAWTAAQVAYYPSLPARLFYGGITEEVLLRWGFMTAVVWALWKLVQRDGGAPRSAVVMAGIVIAAFVFGLAHLPAVATTLGGLDATIVGFILFGNGVVGSLFGALFWRRGLEAAMLAHAVAHALNYLLGRVVG